MADTDKELFEQAIASDPAAPAADEGTAATEQSPAEAGTGPVRDPATGKFVAKADEAPAAVSQPPASAQPAKATEPADHRVPLGELLTARERAQNAERERDEFRRRVEELSRPKPQQPQRPDPWADPGAFAEAVAREQVSPIQQQQEAMIDRFSRLMAVQTHTKPVVDAAYAELEAAVQSDPLMRLEAQRIWQSEHPYGSLVDWHKQRQALKEIGADPAAYKSRLKEEFLKDPEFRKAVIAAVQAEGGQQQNGTRPNTITRLPPSLNRVTSAASNHPGDETALSDQELFRHAAKG